MNPQNKLSQVFCEKKQVTPPIWLMRQAGRYLVEYKRTRESAGSFLSLCYNPDMASEVTLQPIRRFNFDAAIIFSDILIVPHILGLSLDFKDNEGPVVERVTSLEDILKLNVSTKSVQEKMVCEAIRITRSKLDKNKSLIGFVGAPWTVATYIMEGRGKHDFAFSKNIAKNNKPFLEKLLSVITEQTIIHIKSQISAGADVVQIFDSWAGVLDEIEFDEFVIKPTKEIVLSIKADYPDVPIIGFPRLAGALYEKYSIETEVDCVAVDQSVSLDYMKKLKKNVVIQGNIDPHILLGDQVEIKKRVTNLLSNMIEEDGYYRNFIFNLGHGILPQTPVENVKFLVDMVKQE
jgi:uroporphyrinogen decarboxylase